MIQNDRLIIQNKKSPQRTILFKDKPLYLILRTSLRQIIMSILQIWFDIFIIHLGEPWQICFLHTHLYRVVQKLRRHIALFSKSLSVKNMFLFPTAHWFPFENNFLFYILDINYKSKNNLVIDYTWLNKRRGYTSVKYPIPGILYQTL